MNASNKFENIYIFQQDTMYDARKRNILDWQEQPVDLEAEQ